MNYSVPSIKVPMNIPYANRHRKNSIFNFDRQTLSAASKDYMLKSQIFFNSIGPRGGRKYIEELAPLVKNNGNNKTNRSMADKMVEEQISQDIYFIALCQKSKPIQQNHFEAISMALLFETKSFLNQNPEIGPVKPKKNSGNETTHNNSISIRSNINKTHYFAVHIFLTSNHEEGGKKYVDNVVNSLEASENKNRAFLSREIETKSQLMEQHIRNDVNFIALCRTLNPTKTHPDLPNDFIHKALVNLVSKESPSR